MLTSPRLAPRKLASPRHPTRLRHQQQPIAIKPTPLCFLHARDVPRRPPHHQQPPADWWSPRRAHATSLSSSSAWCPVLLGERGREPGRTLRIISPTTPREYGSWARSPDLDLTARRGLTGIPIQPTVTTTCDRCAAFHFHQRHENPFHSSTLAPPHGTELVVTQTLTLVKNGNGSSQDEKKSVSLKHVLGFSF
jgi:hypothetical protein